MGCNALFARGESRSYFQKKNCKKKPPHTRISKIIIIINAEKKNPPPAFCVPSHRVGSVDDVFLLAEVDVLAAAEYFVNALPVEDRDPGLEVLDLLQQGGRTWKKKKKERKESIASLIRQPRQELPRSLTVEDLLSGEVRAPPGGPLHDVGEPDAHVQQLVVVVGGHGLGDQAREKHAFPCKEEGSKR